MTTESAKRLLVSYLTHRRVLGALGVALPVVLALWGFGICECVELQDSISDYYSQRTRDVFVGIIFAIAWFLFAYRGYERKDDVVGDLACLFAIGVALFPNTGAEWEKTVHFISATGLFLALAYFSLFLFTKSDGSPTPEKRVRNRIYMACGAVILASVALIAVYFWFLDDTGLSEIKPVFWLESMALWSFAASWFVKGDTLWKDAEVG